MELVGKYVVAGTVAGYILILDPYTLKTIHSIKDNAGSVYSICPLNNEEFAISTSAGRVKIYLTNGTEKMDIPVTTELIYKYYYLSITIIE